MTDIDTIDDLPKEVKWSWSTDPLGRVISVSANFSSSLGALAAKNIIGNSFWGFCDNLSQPNADWKDLSDAFHGRKRIRKFVFSYMAQGQVVKLKLEGTPVFNRGQYIGYKGFGSECDKDEITASDMVRNALSYAVESAGLGLGVFNHEGTLQEFTDKLHRLLMPAGVTIAKNMTMATVMSYIKARNTVNVLRKGEEDYTGEEIIIALRDRTSLHLTIFAVQEGGFVMKVEEINTIAQNMRRAADANRRLKDENAILVRRMEDYKSRLDNIVTQKIPTSSSPLQGDKIKSSPEDNYFKRLINFYENQMDVGILVTDLEGKLESANYVFSEMLGFKTARDLLSSAENVSSVKHYDSLRQEVTDTMLKESQPRLERELEITSQYGSVIANEVITIYPSIVKPEKIISFLYEKSGDYYGDIEKVREEIRAELDNNKPIINHDFMENALGNIRTSVQVIAGYSDKDMLQYVDEQAKKDNFTHIHNSCISVLHRIQDVENLYTAFSEDNQFGQNKFDPENVIHHICSVMNSDILRKDINWVVELSDHGLDIICDQDVLKTSLLRLVQNSVGIGGVNSNITLRIKGDFVDKKLSFVLSDESDMNFEEMLSKEHKAKVADEHNILFNLKASKFLLEKMGFTLNITSFAGLGNTIYVTAPQDILVYKKTNDDDIAI